MILLRRELCRPVLIHARLKSSGVAFFFVGTLLKEALGGGVRITAHVFPPASDLETLPLGKC